MPVTFSRSQRLDARFDTQLESRGRLAPSALNFAMRPNNRLRSGSPFFL